MLFKNLDEVKKRFNNVENPYGKGNASNKIVNHIVNFLWMT